MNVKPLADRVLIEPAPAETNGKNVVENSLFVHNLKNSFFRFLRDFVNFYFICGCRGAAN